MIDLKWLISQCEEDSYPLPWIEDLLVKQAKASCFTVMDLKDAFHQMPVHPDSRRYTGSDRPIGMLGCCPWVGKMVLLSDSEMWKLL